MTTLLTAVRALLADIEDERPDITAVAYDDGDLVGNFKGDGSTAAIYLTRRASLECDSCGEPLTRRPGPYTWVTYGEAKGAWSQQHGCGAWNSPEEVTVTIDTLEGIDGVLEALVAELDEYVRAIRES